jgi:signal transduction histidine kinase
VTSTVKEIKAAIKVAGRAVEYWGSQSISSDSSAIFELVKNARDADATSVEITFENVEEPDGRIIISDDGHGMTRNDVENRWLVAGTDFKIANPKSRGGRRMWGEMGIGRFSCERLSDRTTLISYPREVDEKVVMSFDWKKYKDPKITFDQVVHSGYVDKKEDSKIHGVKLILEGLKSKWSAAKIRSLKRELGSYILPPELKGPDDFDIKITAEEFNLRKEQIESSIIRIAPLRMRAEYDGKKMTIKIYDVENEIKKWHEREPLIDSEKTCGPFKFGLFFYTMDKSGDTKWESYYRDHLKEVDVGEFLREHSGIYLYRDYAWMKPYGGSYDWLGLEGKRVQRRSKIGRSQVYGIVSISQEQNPGIRPTAHREVLQGNQSFEDLKLLILHAIKELENYRQEVKVSQKQVLVEKTEVMAGNNITQITKLCRARESLKKEDIVKIQEYARATQKYIDEFKKEVEEESWERAEIRQHELNILSLGLVTSYVAHEIVLPVESTADVLGEVRTMMDKTDFTKILSNDLVKQGFEWLETLETNTRKIVHFLSFVNEMSSHLTASRMGSGRSSQIKISDLWESVSKGFKIVSNDSQIKTEYVEHKKDLKIGFNRIDLESILSNLMTNAIDALKKNKSEQAIIRLDVSYLKDGLSIKFSDNGEGVKFKEPEDIFEPFVTTHKTSDDVVYGHGLGLSIVREILRRHNGTISVSSPGHFERGTTFTIRVPSESAKMVV